jgi:hypothetical protein
MKSKKLEIYKVIIGLVGLIISVFFIFYFPNVIALVTDFLEKYFSPDHNINSAKRLEIKAYVAFFILLWVICSVYILFDIHNKVVRYINNLISWTEVSNFFKTDPLCSRSTHNSFILWIGPILGLMSYFYYLISGIEENEGIIENISTYLFLFTIIIMLAAVTKINNINVTKEVRSKIIIFVVLITISVLVIYGEEISWGQQFFHWKSPEAISKYNYQNETNFHNFFNPLFKYIYPIVGMVLFVSLFFSWFFPKNRFNYLFNLFLPHQSLFFLISLYTFTTFLKYREVSEQLLADICFLYSIRFYMCLKFPISQGNN